MERKNLALLCDFYELTMAYAYWKEGLDQRRSCFHLFFRRPPFKGGFTIASGLESVVSIIQNFKYEKADLEYLSQFFEKPFIEMLSKLTLSVSIDAVEEGCIVFPHEPLLRVEGPLLECQLLESALLNAINFPTLIATKAARICLAAEGDRVIEFGLRRAQGIDGAMTATRASFVGGCVATSNVLGGKEFGIPVQGTHAHSWIMAFDKEEEAFDAYARIFPDSSVLLVDTYDTIEGVKKAIQVGLTLKEQGYTLKGIRLDSGDLARLSIEARKLLDKAGLIDTQIVASNELDEFIISELKKQGAKITVWGVGTSLVTGKDQAALDGVYKISALQERDGTWRYTLKLSEQLTKVSNPGILQVRRFQKDGAYIGDVLYDRERGLKDPSQNIDPFDPTKRVDIPAGAEGKDLLVPIFKDGKLIYSLPLLTDIQEKTKKELSKLSPAHTRNLNPQIYPVGMENSLYELKTRLIKTIREKAHA